MGYGSLRWWIERRRIVWRPTVHGWFVIGWLAFVCIHFVIYACMMPYFTEYGTWYFSPEFMTLWLFYGVGIALFGGAIAAAARFCAAAVGLARISHHAGKIANSVPLLRRSSARRNRLSRHCLFQAVAHRDEKCGLAAPLSRLPRGLATATAAAAILFGGDSPFFKLPPLEDCRPACVAAGQWLAAKLPAGQKIGSFSSGRLSYFAAAQQVINLDGLMNDRQYFEQYIKTKRIPEYFRLRKIDYLADYASADEWRSRRFWGIDLGTMQLVRWWPIGGDESYGIWKALPNGRRRDALDPCEGGCDRVSQIQFAADVLQRFEVIDEDALPSQLRQASQARKGSEGAAARRVFTSIVDPGTLRLRHVLIPEDKIASLGLTRRNIDVPMPKQIVFGGSLELIGVDVPRRHLERGQRLFLTRFWTLRGRSRIAKDATVELWLCRNPASENRSENRPSEGRRDDQDQRLWHATQPCHGTHPFDRWTDGEIVVETYGITVPSDMARGDYAVVLRVKDAGGYLPPDGDRSPAGACRRLPGQY